MKKQEKLHVTLPSIPIAFDAFAPPTMQDLSTYFIVVPIAISTPCLEDHPPFWLFLHENVVILYWLCSGAIIMSSPPKHHSKFPDKKYSSYLHHIKLTEHAAPSSCQFTLFSL
jgi:hypothetical protein